ncbi:MAG: hypothetical protein LWX52_16820 [Deltaproteobacteria bacterium]|jgi:protein-S-isoprenylcysteine O-methyltransferase Ste14|nr:hypothetical protein [Deltaproteobacteria bacterium]
MSGINTAIFVGVFSVLYYSIMILSVLEKKARTSNSFTAPSLIIDDKSLKWFKYARLSSTFLAALECSIYPAWNPWLFILAAPIVIFGFFLRVSAIRTLGPFWSFHVVKYPEQPIIKKNIYRFVPHPAYMGNIFLVGLYLFVGAEFTSCITFFWLILFALHRISLEQRYQLCC